MKTRILHTRYWTDSWILSFDRSTRFLLVYLLTNQYVNICGIYELPDQIIIMETGLTKAQISNSKKELGKSGKVSFQNGWVQIKNVDKYNKYRNSPKNETAYKKEMDIVPSEFVLLDGTGIDTSIDTSMYTNDKSGIINKESGIRNKKENMNALRSQIKGMK